MYTLLLVNVVLFILNN